MSSPQLVAITLPVFSSFAQTLAITSPLVELNFSFGAGRFPSTTNVCDTFCATELFGMPNVVAVITATVKTPKDFFSENFASAAECDIDSNPTNAHGASAKIVKTPPTGLLSEEYAGTAFAVAFSTYLSTLPVRPEPSF